MHEITEKNAKMWSRLGPRAVYGAALTELIGENERVYALSADLGQSSGLARLMKSQPDRYINTGIAEQNLIGVAAGMAKQGLIPFASSFAPFITHRCADQIRMNMGYMHLNIKTVGLGSGVSMGYLGFSHYGIEDIAMMRAIPGITILSPADCAELIKCVQAAAEIDGPVYIRMTGEPGMPVVYREEYSFEVGRAERLASGTDVLLAATGSMVSTALAAAEALRAEGISCAVLNMHTIKPFDAATLVEMAQAVLLVVTMEEHSMIGGLGSAVAEHLSAIGYDKRIVRLGLPDAYGKAGSYPYMLEKSGLTAENAIRIIKGELLK